jgi:hypothetical protein
MSRPSMSRIGSRSSGIPSKSEISDSMSDKDCKEDVTVVVHSEQHPVCQHLTMIPNYQGKVEERGDGTYTRKETVNWVP